MGIKSLNKIIGHNATTTSLDRFKGCNVGIDVSIYLYKYSNKCHEKGHGFFLHGFFEMVLEFYKHDITPIFVFDGAPPEAKMVELEERKKSQNKAIARLSAVHASVLCGGVGGDDAPDIRIDIKNWTTFVDQIRCGLYGIDDLDTIDKYQSIIKEVQDELSLIVDTGISVTRMVKKLLWYLRTVYIQAPGEADHCLSWLATTGQISAVFSEDMDMLAHGVPILVKNFMNITYFINKGVTVYDIDDIYSDLKMDRRQFVDLCILCGCDYNTSHQIKGMGPATALKMIREHDNIECVLDNLPKRCTVGPDGCKHKLCRKMFSGMKDKPFTPILSTD